MMESGCFEYVDNYYWDFIVDALIIQLYRRLIERMPAYGWRAKVEKNSLFRGKGGHASNNHINRMMPNL